MLPDDFARVKGAFDERYYRWALADADRELSNGLPWVRMIRGGSALKFMEHMAVPPPPPHGAAAPDERFAEA